MMDRAHVDELVGDEHLPFYNAFHCFFLSPALSLFAHRVFFYRYIWIYVCCITIVNSEFHAKKDFFFSEIFAL